MKRILHVIWDLNRGGAETLITEIFKNIDRNKLQFDFLVYGGNGVYDREVIQLGGKIFYLKKRFSKNIFASLKELYKFFKMHPEYETVHCHLTGTAGFILKMAKKAGVKRTIAHSHIAGEGNMGISFLRKMLYRTSRKMLCKYADYTFACSSDALTYLNGKSKYGNKIVRNAIDVEKFEFNSSDRDDIRRKLNIRDNETVYCHIGRFAFQKNHEYLIDRFYEVHIKNPNTKLILVGKGDLQQAVLDKVRELNLLGSVIFTGVIENTYAYLSASDMFVFPSRYEGLGIVLIEAQANGLKCITSDRVPIEADATGNVKFLPLEDEEAWVNEMMNGKRDFSIASEVGEKVKRAGYDIHEVADELTEFYLSW